MIDYEDLAKGLKKLNTVPVNLFEIRDRMLFQGLKVDAINAIWDELWKHVRIVYEETWKIHADALNNYGADLTPELELQAIIELRHARQIPLKALWREYMNRAEFLILEFGQKDI